MDNPKTKGEISEVICKSELVKRGLTVLEPTVENVRYDFVIDNEGEFHRLQCKTAYKKDESILSFNVSSTQCNNTINKKVDYHGEVEYFIVYSPDEEEVYVFFNR